MIDPYCLGGKNNEFSWKQTAVSLLFSLIRQASPVHCLLINYVFANPEDGLIHEIIWVIGKVTRTNPFFGRTTKLKGK